MRAFGHPGMVDNSHLLFVKNVHKLLTSHFLLMSCVGFFCLSLFSVFLSVTFLRQREDRPPHAERRAGNICFLAEFHSHPPLETLWSKRLIHELRRGDGSPRSGEGGLCAFSLRAAALGFPLPAILTLHSFYFFE